MNLLNGSFGDEYAALLSKYTRCNEPPSPDEVSAIQELSRRTQILLDEMGEETEATDSLVVERRSELQAVAHLARGVLSPFRRLPLEIVQEIIFFAVVPPGEGRISYPVLDRSNGPWLIGKICSQWRSIVNALPQVWSSVILSMDADISELATQEVIASLVHCLRIWLERSNSLPLYVDFEASRIPWRAKPFLSLIVAQSARWKEVHLGRLHTFLLSNLAPIRHNLDLLEHIHFEFTGNPDRETVALVRDLFSVAPRLCSVSFPRRPEDMSLPWSQLKQLRYEYTSDFPDLLSRVTNIEELWVMQTREPIPVDLTPRIELKRLRKLTWLIGPFEAAPEFVQLLSLPTLEAVVIPESVIPQTLHSVKKYNISLGFKNLCVHVCSFTSHTFELLKLVPFLETLSFPAADQRPQHYLRLLRALTPTFSEKYGPSFLPKLRRLRLEVGNESSFVPGSRNSGFESQALLDMLTSRWSLAFRNEPPTYERSRLSSFHSKFCLHKSQIPEPSTLTVFDDLRKEGMEIVIEFTEIPICEESIAFELFSEALG